MMSNIQLGFYDYLTILSYGLIAVSYTMREMRWLRVITVVACLMDIAIYYFIRPGQPLWVHIVMNTVFVVINVYQLYVLRSDGIAGPMSREAKWLYDSVFSLLTPGEFRKVLAAGSWQTASDGHVLLEKGRRVASVMVLADGSLDLYLDKDKWISSIQRGSIVGEMSFLADRPASADVRAKGEARLFSLTHVSLGQFKRDQPNLFSKLSYIFALQVVEKLVNADDRALR
jgi:hypothetical protein